MPVLDGIGFMLGLGIAFLQGYLLKELNWRFAFEMFRLIYVLAVVFGLYNAVTWDGGTTSSWLSQVAVVLLCVAFLMGWYRSWKIWRLV